MVFFLFCLVCFCVSLFFFCFVLFCFFFFVLFVVLGCCGVLGGLFWFGLVLFGGGLGFVALRFFLVEFPLFYSPC